MNGEASNVVGVSLERRHLLARVVVEDAEVEVVRAADKPIPTSDEAHAADGYFGDFEGLDHGLVLVEQRGEKERLGLSWRGGRERTYASVNVVDDDVTRVESGAVGEEREVSIGREASEEGKRVAEGVLT